MPRLVPEQPLYLLTEPDAVFAILHPPSGVPTGTAALICPPFGWDEVASYRSRRHWAEHLARRGHTVLRIDLPGAGDSAGSPRDPERLGAWDSAVRAALDFLRAGSRCTRVAVVGLGLGGLLALRAVESGADLDDLVLWGVPASERSLVRELRAFARLQATGPATAEAGLEAGGFVVTPATLDALAARPDAPPGGARVGRALLLDRDGTPVASALHDRLAKVEDVQSAPGPGYERMTAHPQTSVPPVAVFARVARWLEGASPRRIPAPARRPPTASALTLPVDGGVVRETPVRIGGADGSFGILAEPDAGEAGDVRCLLLNAGAVRRTGPNRLWVEAARAWAAAGLTSLRLDLPRIGDGGTGAGITDTRDFYRREQVEQVREALDWLARDGGTRFVIAGLCSGGHWAVHAAVDDPRVAAVVLINTTALLWDRNVLIDHWPPGPKKLLDPHGMHGDWSLARLGDVGGALVEWTHETVARWSARRRTRRQVKSMLVELAARGTSVTLAYAGGQQEQLGLEQPAVRRRLGRAGVTVVDLPGDDHSVRPLPAQRKVREVLDAALAAQRRPSDQALRAV